ncbi:MAG TPA: hypothetical protein VFQ85_12965 [Mycobacteriales bacterium]|nr:hypothetical protein [Mycobacteriales bacterium]
MGERESTPEEGAQVDDEQRGRRPSNDVEIGFDIGSPLYWAWVEKLYGFDQVEWWLELGDLLAGRPGWHVDIDTSGGRLGLLWSFGSFGRSLFNVTAVGLGEFSLFDYAADENHFIVGVDALRGWLEDNEPRYNDEFAGLRSWLAADDWYMFCVLPYDVRVTVDEDGRWLATVHGLRAEVAVAADLPAVLAAVREMLCGAVGAPAEVAPRLRLTARLDEPANAAIAARPAANEE